MERTLTSAKCGICGRTHASDQPTKIRCCGRPILLPGMDGGDPITQMRTERNRNLSAHCFACNHWKAKDGKFGCELFDGTRCDSVKAILNGASCFDQTNPKFADYYGRGIGFIASSYLICGGTEVWHQTLLPRLGTDVAGFVVLDPTLATGDLRRLKCKTGIGIEQARQLASQCGTLVAWGAGLALGDVVEGLEKKPKVISVAHCDARNEWTVEFMRGQSSHTDIAVHLCPRGIDAVPEALRASALMIPNAPDPERIKATRSRRSVRDEIGVGQDSIMLLITARISQEKRIDLLVDAVMQLPKQFELVIAGASAKWSTTYEKEIRSRADDRIHFLPSVEMPGDLLNACDAVLSASEYEGFGLAMAEGVLAGKPLIATQVGFLEGHPDLATIVNLDAGPNEWASIIESSFFDRDELSRKAIVAAREIAAEYPVERFVSVWRSMLRS